MPVGRYVYRMPHTVSGSETVRSAAQLMERESGGCVVRVEDGRPVGMLTDRDISLRILGRLLDPSVVSVGQLSRRPPIVVSAQASLGEAVRMMRLQRVRRVLVVDQAGKLMGLLCVDDVLRILSSEVAQLAEALRTQLSGPAAREREPPRTAR